MSNFHKRTFFGAQNSGFQFHLSEAMRGISTETQAQHFPTIYNTRNVEARNAPGALLLSNCLTQQSSFHSTPPLDLPLHPLAYHPTPPLPPIPPRRQPTHSTISSSPDLPLRGQSVSVQRQEECGQEKKKEWEEGRRRSGSGHELPLGSCVQHSSRR